MLQSTQQILLLCTAFTDHFTDEATFHIPENIHRHHVMMRRQDNLYAVTDHQNSSPKMNVWFELTYSWVILPSFLGILRNHMVHQVEGDGTICSLMELHFTTLRLWTINKTGISYSWTLHRGLISEPDQLYQVTGRMFDILHLVSGETEFHCDIFCPDFTPLFAYVWELRN